LYFFDVIIILRGIVIRGRSQITSRFRGVEEFVTVQRQGSGLTMEGGPKNRFSRDVICERPLVPKTALIDPKL